ncbi:MAG: nitroreductase family protein [Candidatus Hermodarchaeota archaeon]
MDLKEIINLRRSYRSITPIKITQNIINDLAECASLAPSCKNSQPWRFVFVFENNQLQKLFKTLKSPNDKWAVNASMIIVIFSNVKFDCIINERLYYLFDSGIATAFILLRATELGLVAHPIAGFEESMVKEVLNIPVDMRVITLIIIGKKSETVDRNLTELMINTEFNKPSRKNFKEFAYLNKYTP